MVELEQLVTPTEANSLRLKLETPFKHVVEHEGQKRTLIGSADYSLWYDRTDMGTNLVVVKGKQFGDTAAVQSQCLAYMGKPNSMG
jgi:hypothetical protein